jgi:hypothetical protein
MSWESIYKKRKSSWGKVDYKRKNKKTKKLKKTMIKIISLLEKTRDQTKIILNSPLTAGHRNFK